MLSPAFLESEYVQPERPGCPALLFCCAFLAPEQIPRELFATAVLADGVFAAADGQLALDDAVTRMLAFSLVTADETDLSMHRLVQHVIRDRLGDQREHWLTLSLHPASRQVPRRRRRPSHLASV